MVDKVLRKDKLVVGDNPTKPATTDEAPKNGPQTNVEAAQGGPPTDTPGDKVEDYWTDEHGNRIPTPPGITDNPQIRVQVEAANDILPYLDMFGSGDIKGAADGFKAYFDAHKDLGDFRIDFRNGNDDPNDCAALKAQLTGYEKYFLFPGDPDEKVQEPVDKTAPPVTNEEHLQERARLGRQPARTVFPTGEATPTPTPTPAPEPESPPPNSVTQPVQKPSAHPSTAYDWLRSWF